MSGEAIEPKSEGNANSLTNDEFESKLSHALDFRLELGKESDRGLALLSTSYVENQLEQLIQKILIGTDKQKKELLSGFGPLATFSAKIKLLYSFGILPKTVFQELDRIRLIRNEFAHSHSIISFETKVIANKCDNLTFIVQYKHLSPRRKFLNSISGIYGVIDGLLHTQRQIEAPQDIDLQDRDSEYRKIILELFQMLGKEL